MHLVAREHRYTLVAIAEPLDLFLIRDDLAATHAVKLRHALRNRAFRNHTRSMRQGVPLNSFKNLAMTHDQAMQMLDYGEWSAHLRAGYSPERALRAARATARTALTTLASTHARCPFPLCATQCFRRLGTLSLNVTE